MATNFVPLEYLHVKKSIELQNKVFKMVWGEAPVSWDTKNFGIFCKKTANHKSVLIWMLQIFIGLSLYGVGINLWNILFVSDMSTLAYVVCLATACVSVYMAGVAQRIYTDAGKLSSGLNELVGLQQELSNDFKSEWRLLMPKKLKRMKLIGICLYYTMYISACGMVIPVGLTIFNLDGFYYFFGLHQPNNGWNENFVLQIALLGIRIVSFSLAGVLVLRVAALMFIFWSISFQSYIGILWILTEIENLRKVIQSCRIFMVIHIHLSSFFSRVHCLLIFSGQACCVTFLWVGIRGWGFLSSGILVFTFLFEGIYMSLLVVLLLSVFGSINEDSVAVLYSLKQRLVHTVSARKQKELRREIKSLRPISFVSGQFFPITMTTPGSFLIAGLENLTTAVLTC